MNSTRSLRPFCSADIQVLREVYADAIETQASEFYTKEQIKSWSALAWLPGILEKTFQEGKGWLSFEGPEVAAFAIRYPLNRLALLYCRGCFARRGHASKLISCIEREAVLEGQSKLVSEASFLSYPLLSKLGWDLVSMQNIAIGGVGFERYLMQKFF